MITSAVYPIIGNQNGRFLVGLYVSCFCVCKKIPYSFDLFFGELFLSSLSFAKPAQFWFIFPSNCCTMKSQLLLQIYYFLVVKKKFESICAVWPLPSEDLTENRKLFKERNHLKEYCIFFINDLHYIYRHTVLSWFVEHKLLPEKKTN